MRKEESCSKFTAPISEIKVNSTEAMICMHMQFNKSQLQPNKEPLLKIIGC